MYPPFLIMAVSLVLVVCCTYDCNCLSNKSSDGKSPSSSPSCMDSAKKPTPSPSTAVDFSPEESEEGPEKANAHDYFITYLPTCPATYTLYLDATASKTTSNRKGKLKTGRYQLCRQRGRARLRECATNSQRSCVTRSEYLVTVVENWSSSTPSRSTNNSVQDRPNSSSSMCQPSMCPSTQLMAINMKNPMDCGSFFICIMGQHFLLTCPPGHLFSEDYGVCIESKYTSCTIHC